MYITSTDFKLPENKNIKIIMIAIGTGAAVFTSFLEERSNYKNWIFIGQRTKQYNFYYKDFFEKLEKEKKLILSTAFSRDQKEKVYVQHKIYENSKNIYGK